MLPLADNRAVRIEALARAVRRGLTALPEAAPFLADWPDLAVVRATRPRDLPVCRWLPDLPRFAARETRALTREFAAAADTLEWRQTYSAADFGPEFLERYGWTELIGLRGPIGSEKIACGFLMLGPGTEYPAHAHEADELYWTLAGEALWMRGEEGFVARAPGVIIAHSSWMPHATRTLQQPLLALYVWRGGDLAAKSTIIGRENERTRR
jgi:mannose-6-phosphate isomerase-like protein (cupin superfamily)